MARARETLRVLIADEHGIFRGAVREAFEREADLEVACEATDGLGAVAAAEEFRPDVAVLSTGLGAVDGVQASCMISEQVPECRVILLAAAEDQRLLTDGLGCGASGYLTKESSLQELIAAVRAVARGETQIPSPMLGPLLNELLERRQSHDQALERFMKLSRREREVLGLLARGAGTSAIADQLFISSETARTHVQNILGKLGVHSRLEAASYVVENGLLRHVTGNGQPEAFGSNEAGNSALALRASSRQTR